MSNEDELSQAFTSTIPDAPAPISQDAEASNAHLERTQLLSLGRGFLGRPEVQDKNVEEKRTFLDSKGLGGEEIEGLLNEQALQAPRIPPPTYPRTAPSNLPVLLLGLTRLFAWIAGGSAALMFVYYLFLPRIMHSKNARMALALHQSSLFSRLSGSLVQLRETQKKCYDALPQPQSEEEGPRWAGCSSLDEVLESKTDSLTSLAARPQPLPYITLLRCTIADLTSESADFTAAEGTETVPTTQTIFQLLYAKLPWLSTESGTVYQDLLWQTLSTSPRFTSSSPAESSTDPTAEALQWKYTPPPPPAPPSPSPLIQSLTSLRAAMPVKVGPSKEAAAMPSMGQRTLQALFELTGYVTTQTYAMPSNFRQLGVPPSPPTQEEEMRKEIRALKGLVLNRRSFFPTTRPPMSGGGLRPSTSAGV